MSEKKPREIAAEVLRRQTGSGHRAPDAPFTEDAFERGVARANLPARDRALCQELVYGVVRWQAALDWLIAQKTGGRPQKPALQNLLRLGLYQIFWLDRIPNHAAVFETVEQARQSGFGAQAGFVNAVLRGYLREFDETKKLLAGLKVSNPAVGWSHPKWLVEKWRRRFGDERARQLLEWNNTPPKTFARVNALKFRGSRGDEAPISRSQINQSLLMPAAANELKNIGDLLALWRDEGVEYDFVRRDWFEESLVFELKSHPPLAALPSFQQGFFYAQDPGTLLAVHELNPQAGETVLDFCAAPGGKLTYIAQLMNDEGNVFAHDVFSERLKLIRENCERLGVKCVEAIQNPKLEDQNLKFDRILADAPCSNTGVMRRRVDLRWRIQPQEISRLQQTQLDLLELAAAKLKSGGTLVYSTCSLEPEENSGVVENFLRGHAEFKLEGQRELLPFADNVDGAFVARLKKSP